MPHIVTKVPLLRYKSANTSGSLSLSRRKFPTFVTSCLHGNISTICVETFQNYFKTSIEVLAMFGATFTFVELFQNVLLRFKVHTVTFVTHLGVRQTL